MIFSNKSFSKKFSLLLWITVLIFVGSFMGIITKPNMVWYHSLNHSSLKPPDKAFPIVWTCLYGILGFCGWRLWQESPSPSLKFMKILYISQLLLNWSWTPLFFQYHLTGFSLLVLVMINSLVIALMGLTYKPLKEVFFLLIPYVIWLLWATYLNYYIVCHN